MHVYKIVAFLWKVKFFNGLTEAVSRTRRALKFMLRDNCSVPSVLELIQRVFKTRFYDKLGGNKSAK